MSEAIAVKKTSLLAMGIVVALGVGFAIGFFANNFLPVQQQYSGLNDSDKNFLVTLANSQVQLTSSLVAQKTDWCFGAGGTWRTQQQEGELRIQKQQADSLKEQGFDVYAQDGNWMVKVMLTARTECILPLKKA